MAFHDRRTLDGVYSVRQSARYIMNYRYAEERMMRMMAGWIALTPQLPVKLEMARQVYEDALHADALGKRLGELRSQAHVSRSPNEAFTGLMDEIENKEQWEDTIERLVGIYRVMKPHLVAHYSAHVAAANPVYEPPTLRILAHLMDDEKRHIDRDAVAEMRKLQPYVRPYGTPSALWTLQELDARDKHKLLTMTQTIAEHAEIQLTHPSDFWPLLRFHQGPFDDKAIIAEIDGPIGATSPKVEVGSKYAFEISFQQGILDPVAEYTVRKALRQILDSVDRVIAHFERLIIDNPTWIR